MDQEIPEERIAPETRLARAEGSLAHLRARQLEIIYLQSAEAVRRGRTEFLTRRTQELTDAIKAVQAEIESIKREILLRNTVIDP